MRLVVSAAPRVVLVEPGRALAENRSLDGTVDGPSGNGRPDKPPRARDSRVPSVHATAGWSLHLVGEKVLSVRYEAAI
jgi:hypothetical protein